MTADQTIPAADRADEIEDWLGVMAPMLLAYFLRRVTPPDEAADLLAEALLVLWRRAEAIPAEDRAARMWAYGVARNVLRGHRRTSRRRSALTERLRAELASTEEVAHPADDRVLDLRSAIERLKPIDREIVRLVHWDGLSLVEAAEVVGMREGTVRSRYHRARSVLRGQLG
ncbi:RNA polymerase sigma factor [Nocardioides sp. CCNWLW239]|uniref:RNA polymerase sigma factor n=1 Tax=Nocardioides sp. CCNWLW239 TaxID=3128902 RepID=UPI00301AC184